MKHIRLKKQMAVFSLATALLLGSALPISAHDGWSQTNSPVLAQGQVAYVDLLLGNHSNEHKSYRITGQWNKDSAKVYVVTPSGQKADISKSLFYSGEAATQTEPAVNNGFIASFSSQSPGAYIISAESDSVSKSGAAPSRSLRSAKSFVAVSDIATPGRIEALKGFSKAVSTDRAEWVPAFNPAAATPGKQVSVQLLVKGVPQAGVTASLIRRSNSEAQEWKTDDEGKVTFTLGEADYYLLRASITDEKEKKEGEYAQTSYSATMTFSVQNEAASLPTGNVNPMPYIYVNGKLTEEGNASFSDGTTVVTADFVRANIDPAYKGAASVALRTAAEQAGASVEFLPAVASTRAAVLVYTK
ncbi:DUF4198 domain-containing protein [Paenibacillus thalictri]|uniref:DUF4198 domain-containing protein n=1 Tax=Paenibacillus thalictri TaxID=2527873 RepID=A0A4Q9DIC4_9BACL|nr:DUF4198 domain-containing protein [Paenibacillus thalictri]TBL69920.1 DUF4198 domain-containing protein [Paenibacillus thalictri]